VRSWSWVTFANLQEARFPILQESAYTTDSDTELSLALHVRIWTPPHCKPRCFGARADCTRIFGLLIRHRFDAGP